MATPTCLVVGLARPATQREHGTHGPVGRQREQLQRSVAGRGRPVATNHDQDPARAQETSKALERGLQWHVMQARDRGDRVVPPVEQRDSGVEQVALQPPKVRRFRATPPRLLEHDRRAIESVHMVGPRDEGARQPPGAAADVEHVLRPREQLPQQPVVVVRVVVPPKALRQLRKPHDLERYAATGRVTEYRS